MEIKDTINIISVWSVVVPFVQGSLLYRRLGRDSKLIWGIAALGTIPQLMRYFTGDDNLLHIVYNIYSPLEFIFLALFFQDKFDLPSHQKCYRYSIASYIPICVLLLVTIGIRGRFVNEWVCVNNLVYTGWCLMYITQQFRSEREDFAGIREPGLWYVAGWFFYASCTLLNYSLWHHIKYSSDPVVKNLTIIHSLFNIALYLFFSVGLFIDARPGRRYQHGLPS